MGLSLGFVSCSIDLYFCFCASSILSWLLWLCSIVWSQGVWFLQLRFFPSRLLCLFGVFCVSIQILNHKKEWNPAICRDVDGPRDCHTEWSKSEREKQISYINTYTWILEKWYSITGLQGRNRDTDVENKRMDTKGEKQGVGVMVGWTGRLGLTYTH